MPMTFCSLEIAALRSAFLSGTISAGELVDRVVVRIAEWDDPAVWISRSSDDELRARARELDTVAAADPGTIARLPLFGIPFAVKDNIDGLEAGLAKVSQELGDQQAAQQSLGAQQAQQQAQQQAAAQAPPPDVLYNNALRDYNGDKNDLATQEFSDYLKFYPNTDLAGNCYFYLGEIQFRAGNYQQAAQNYDQVLQNFPSGNKAASAQLKKGFSLIELGKQEDGEDGLKEFLAELNAEQFSEVQGTGRMIQQETGWTGGYLFHRSLFGFALFLARRAMSEACTGKDIKAGLFSDARLHCGNNALFVG